MGFGFVGGACIYIADISGNKTLCSERFGKTVFLSFCFLPWVRLAFRSSCSVLRKGISPLLVIALLAEHAWLNGSPARLQ